MYIHMVKDILKFHCNTFVRCWEIPKYPSEAKYISMSAYFDVNRFLPSRFISFTHFFNFLFYRSYYTKQIDTDIQIKSLNKSIDARSAKTVITIWSLKCSSRCRYENVRSIYNSWRMQEKSSFYLRKEQTTQK